MLIRRTIAIVLAAAGLAAAAAVPADAVTIRTGTYTGEASGADGGGTIRVRVGRENRRPQLDRLTGTVKWSCNGDELTTKLPHTKVLKRNLIRRDGKVRYAPVDLVLSGRFNLNTFRGTLVMKSPYCQSRPMTVQLRRG